MSCNKILLVILPLIMIMGSCKDDDDLGNNNLGTFDCTFLKAGNQWTYEYDQFFSSGEWETKIISSSNGVYTVTQQVDNGLPTTQYWYTEGPFLKAYDQGETRADGSTIFKCGASVGDKWSVPSNSTQGGTVFYEVVALNESIRTQDGTYLCTKIAVTFSYAFNTQYNYWSETYGLVFQDGLIALDMTDKNF